MIYRNPLAVDHPLAGRFSSGTRFTFEAAHQLPSLGPTHKRARMHGHSYTVEVVLAADRLTAHGFVTDIDDLTPFGKFLSEELDHRVLDEVVPFEPTAELLAQYLATWFITNMEPQIPGRLVAVRISETPGSWVSFELDRARYT